MVSVDSWWDALIRGRFEAVLELVLCAIADDYESLEIILSTINEWDADRDPESWPARSAVPVSRPEVINALRELTREGYAHTYMLDTKEPHVQSVDFSEDEVDDLWFYATPKGIQVVEHFLGKEEPE